MTEERIVAYLLEELPEEELEQFEDECFARESWPDEIDLVETDLIDDYLRGVLAPEQRRRFEQYYLTTAARMERVRRAAALLRHVDGYTAAATAETVAVPPTRQTWTGRLRGFWDSLTRLPRAAVALTVVAVVVGGWWLSSPGVRSPRAVATLTLTASNSDRAEGVQAGRVKLTRDDEALRISLMLPDGSAPAARYKVTLEDVDGEVKPLEVSGQDTQSVSVLLPAAQLARGRYAMKLIAVDGDGELSVGRYFFNVE